METTQYMNEGELRVLADTYDSVYLHPVWLRAVRAEGGGNAHPPSPPPWGEQLSRQGCSPPHALSGSPLSLQNSYTCACLASGSVLRLVDAVLGAEIRNGMAIIR